MAERRDPWTVRRVLEWMQGFFARKAVDSPRLSAELLVAHVLLIPRIKIYTDYQRILSDKELATLRDLVGRAGEHEPIAYLTGRAQFFNLDLSVTRDTLIPRPDTETLVENVLQLSRQHPGFEAPRLLDLCTGSGCIALAILSRAKSATAVATDVSAAALGVARANAEHLKLTDRITFLEGDLYQALAHTVHGQPFDLILSNPPYIPTNQIDQLDRNVRDYEPRLALDGGLDGLTLVRKVLAGAGERLTSIGRVFIEIAFDQGPAALQAAQEAPGLTDPRILKDHAGHERVLTAKRAD